MRGRAFPLQACVAEPFRYKCARQSLSATRVRSGTFLLQGRVAELFPFPPQTCVAETFRYKVVWQNLSATSARRRSFPLQVRVAAPFRYKRVR